jgi:hypothetical protein
VRGAGSPARSSARERLGLTGLAEVLSGRARCPGCPARCLVVFLAGRCGRRRGIGAAACWFPWMPGSARYVSRLWCAERALGPREGGRGSGGTGKPGFGGFPGSPGACTFHEPKVRRGMRVLPQHGAPGIFHGHLPVLLAISALIRPAADPCCFAPSSVIGAAGSPFSAVPDWSPLVSVYSRSRDGVSLTSVTSRQGVGVRSGKRRRHAASTSVQAAGGIEPKPRRAAPERANAVLCVRCSFVVRGLPLAAVTAYQCPLCRECAIMEFILVDPELLIWRHIWTYWRYRRP